MSSSRRIGVPLLSGNHGLCLLNASLRRCSGTHGHSRTHCEVPILGISDEAMWLILPLSSMFPWCAVGPTYAQCSEGITSLPRYFANFRLLDRNGHLYSIEDTRKSGSRASPHPATVFPRVGLHLQDARDGSAAEAPVWVWTADGRESFSSCMADRPATVPHTPVKSTTCKEGARCVPCPVRQHQSCCGQGSDKPCSGCRHRQKMPQPYNQCCTRDGHLRQLQPVNVACSLCKNYLRACD